MSWPSPGGWGDELKLAAIIPVKAFGAGKSRLAGILDDRERAALNAGFLDRTLDLAAIFPGLRNTFVVSADDDALDVATSRGAVALRETGPGLNAAIGQAVATARRGGATAALVLPTDLPLATAEDLLNLTAPPLGLTIAPDRRGQGTNALCLAPVEGFTFRFGENSFAAHVEEARRAGLETQIHHAPRLGFDIDTPDDYRAWRASAG